MTYYVYGQPGCRWCVSATRLLLEKKLDYVYIDISEDEGAKAFLRAIGATTVPQVFLDPGFTDQVDVHIGGFEDLKEHLEKTLS